MNLVEERAFELCRMAAGWYLRTKDERFLSLVVEFGLMFSSPEAVMKVKQKCKWEWMEKYGAKV